MNLSQKIVQLRKEKDWTLVELSKAVGISPNNLNRYEKGHSRPSLDAIRKLADVFNVSTDYLLFDEAPRENRLHVFDPIFIKFLENAEGLPEEDKNIARGVLKALLIKNRIEVVLRNPVEAGATGQLT
ncbi:MAG: helix-turn-helix domain-containing protein, partial [Acidobacteriota bacterium]